MTAVAAAAGNRNIAGIGLYVLAVALLSVMDAMIKWLSATYPTPQIVFCRSLFGLLPWVVAAARTGAFAAVRTRRPGAHLVRGLIGLVAALGFFYAFRTLPLADAYAIAFASPLLMTALGVPLLGERVSWRSWAAIAVGLAGVLVMLRPGASGMSGFLSLGAATALIGTVAYAVSAVLIRRLSSTESNSALILYSALVMIAGSAALLPFGFVVPDSTGLALLVAIGLIGGSASFALTQAFRVAPAAVLAPFEYTAMVWAVLFGYVLWGDLPDGWILAGSAVVVASGLYVLRAEMRTWSAQPTSA